MIKHPDRINPDRRTCSTFITRYGWTAIFALCAMATVISVFFLALAQNKL